jgi:ATP-dependent Clp protease ATP-binding subunit ClpC
MEEGRLTDNVGRTVDFKNAIVILTTNVGAETVVQNDDMSNVFGRFGKKDEELDYNDMQKRLKSQMEKVFRPEFLNRLDDIIVFRKLNKKDLKQIVDLELAKVAKRLKEKALTLIVTDEAKDFLIEKGTSTEYGARPLRRAIEQNLEDALSEALLRGEFHGKDVITIRVSDGPEKSLVFDSTMTDVVPAPAAVPPAPAEEVPAAAN